MSTNARILFAGVLTSAIVAVGFGSSLLAQPRIKQPSGYQSPASLQQLIPVRVILPASAEPAHPPQPSTVFPSEAGLETHAVVEKAEGRKQTVDERGEPRRRHVERKSKRIAAREQLERRLGPRILAFGGDEPRRNGF